MPVPEFITDLRASIGHRPLFLAVVTAIVLDAEGRVLLHRRADDGRWWVPGGFLEPGEQPGPAVVREVREETGVEVEAVRLVRVLTEEPHTYPNGDTTQSVDLTFLARPVGGTARVNDDESLEVRWFPRDALPPVEPLLLDMLEKAEAAQTGEQRTWFTR